MTIKHQFVSGKSDISDATIVRPSNWNADHVIGDGTMQIDAASSVGTFSLTSGSLQALKLGTTFAGTFSHAFDLGANSNPSVGIVSSDPGQFGPNLILWHNSGSPALNDQIGALLYDGQNTTPATLTYGKIATYIDTPTAANEASHMIMSTLNGGAGIAALQLGISADLLGSYAHVFDFGITDNPDLLVQNSSTGTRGPNLVLYHNDTGGASDIPGDFLVYGKSSTGVVRQYSSAVTTITAATNAAEASKVQFGCMANGSNVVPLTIGGATGATSGGVQIGAPTGGDKGAGTLNLTSIYFNNSAALSDYEEGSWTPTLTTDGTNFTSVTYSARAGLYRKIGNLVAVDLVLATSAVTIGPATGNVIVTGLPFTTSGSGGQRGLAVAYGGGWVTNTVGHTLIANTVTSIQLWATNAATQMAVANVSATNNSVYGSGVYPV